MARLRGGRGLLGLLLGRRSLWTYPKLAARCVATVARGVRARWREESTAFLMSEASRWCPCRASRAATCRATV